MTLPLTCKYNHVATIDLLPVFLSKSIFDDVCPYFDMSYVRLFSFNAQGCTNYTTSQTITALYSLCPITITVERLEECVTSVVDMSIPHMTLLPHDLSIGPIEFQSKILPWMYLPTVNNDFLGGSYRTTVRDLQREDDTYFIGGETWKRYPLNYYVQSFESCTLSVNITFSSSTQTILLEEVIIV